MPDLGLRVVDREAGDNELELLLHEALAELRGRYGPKAGSPLLAGAEYYVAYAGDRAVGCAALQPVAAGLVELKRMYVPERFRGQGIARALLFRLERQALGRDFARLRLQTGTRQPEAVSLYESAGYRRVEPWGKYAADPNALCFEKELV